VHRIEALRDLSRDHFFALVVSRNVVKAIESGKDAYDAGRHLLNYWASEFALHEREEDEVLWPMVKPAHLVQRARAEHERLDADRQAFAADGRSWSGDRVAAWATALRDHVRFEEDVLFPAIQESWSQGDARAFQEASKSFRLRHRGPGSLGPRKDCPI
jgi:iron-sulfur cluster repair protein YtfE (RIC family)